MPAEAERLRRRLAGRDRWFLIALGSVALIAAPGGIILSHRTTAARPAGCVTTDRAWIMGSATFRYCGPDAVTACRRAGAADRRLAAQCVSIGLGGANRRTAIGGAPS